MQVKLKTTRKTKYSRSQEMTETLYSGLKEMLDGKDDAHRKSAESALNFMVWLDHQQSEELMSIDEFEPHKD